MLYPITDSLEHSANLSIDALAKHHPQPGGGQATQISDPSAFSIEHDAAHQSGREGAIPWRVQRDFILLVDLEPGMSEMLCQIAVVSQKKQTFGLCVEATDVEKFIKFGRQQVEDGIARMRIASGGNESGRFVKNDCCGGLNMHEPAVHLYVIARPGLSAEIGTNLAVNGDSTRRDQIIALPARSQTGGSEIPVEAHGDEVVKPLKR